MPLIKPVVEDDSVVGEQAGTVVSESVTVVSDAENAGRSAIAEASSRVVAKVNDRAGIKSFVQDQVDLGFEGLTVTSFSFERIRLEDGKFLLGADDLDLGVSFQFVPQGSRSLYVIKQSNDKDAEMYYSYDPDGKLGIDGSSMEAKLAEWREQGYGLEDSPLVIKKYMEVMAILTNSGTEFDETIVSLSVPPTSSARFGGAAIQAKFKYHADLNNVIVEARVGTKVKVGSSTFYPWNFSVTGKAS